MYVSMYVGIYVCMCVCVCVRAGAGSGVCGTLTGFLGTRASFLTTHALVSANLTSQINAACGNFSTLSIDCIILLVEATTAVGDVNIYNIYAPCIQGGSPVPAGMLRQRVPSVAEGVMGPDACIDGIAAGAYLNSPQVISVRFVSCGCTHA